MNEKCVTCEGVTKPSFSLRNKLVQTSRRCSSTAILLRSMHDNRLEPKP
uniref:Uncharacterized protein n=1 Tax=Picea sitchensis TaxID=3332 RepID=C0PTQ5_PICSI|nr:unknown [Picea sitchensis]